MSELEEVEAFIRANGANPDIGPLIINGAHEDALRRIGADVDALVAEGVLVVQRPVPVSEKDIMVRL